MNLALCTKPSRYINKEINARHKDPTPGLVRVALAFPDIYDIGMSHLGLKILYSIINALPHAAAERVFAPWPDREGQLRSSGTPLASLETGTPLREFDLVGFSLQYELSFPTILNMLDLGGIPVRASDRDDRHPVVIAGGPCAVNPAPLSRFIDAFVVGDAEEKIREVVAVCRETGRRRSAVLAALSRLEGVYVPGLSAQPVRKVFLTDLDAAPYPADPVVPYTKVVHDRVNIEVSRGCSQGCRFCQAGMIYRPVRERSPEKILALAEESIRNTGYDEVSFTSLSAGDYSQLVPLLRQFNRRFAQRKIALSLPSVRVGAVNDDVLREIRSVRKSGFTIAPEAATDRLRCVINKDFRDDEYEAALETLFRAGWQTVKLYFMIGLPTEEWADVQAIARMAHRARSIAGAHRKGKLNITVGVSPFVPKPHTPFQWSGQDGLTALREKKEFLVRSLAKKVFTVKSHNEHMSFLEAVIARGTEEVGLLIERAWELGGRLDAWSDCFDMARWERAMDETGIDGTAYATRSLHTNEPLPWDCIDTGIAKEYLVREFRNATEQKKTPDCSRKCHACGLMCTSGEYLRHAGPSARVEPAPALRQSFSPVSVRAEFSKTGILRYLSHLELMSVILRALRRAGVPLHYSEGYHPAPRVSFGPALGVGVEGQKEYFDMEVYPPFDAARYAERLNQLLPEGIRIGTMQFIGRKLPSLTSFINTFEYLVSFDGPEPLMHFARVQAADSPVLSLLRTSDIMNHATVKIVLTETREEKVRLGEILREYFGTGAEGALVTRTGQWGDYGTFISPLDIAAIERLPWQKERSGSRGTSPRRGTMEHVE